MGDTLVVTPAEGAWRDWAIRLEYVGEATVSPRGLPWPEGRPVPFGFERFQPLGDWDVRFFAWTDPEGDPGVDPMAFDALFGGPPLLTRSEPRLDYQWYAPALEGLPQSRWALEARTVVDLPGDDVYTLRTISDDAVRVWVDDVLVIDAWEPHGSRVDHAPLGPGSHEIRVRHYQLDGWTEIRVEVVRGETDSTGSAGPH